jgi:hypothetical protein
MESMLEEVRNDNKNYLSKIDELKSNIFGKDRDIDKLNHQIKYGVTTGGLSIGFEHQHAGAGGSIATGNIKDTRSKIE